MPIGTVWIYCLLFVCVFVCVCICTVTVTDISANDKASSIKFCTAFRQRPRQRITIFVNFAPQKPKIGRIGERAGHAHTHVNITVEMRRRKRHVRDAPFVKLRGVWT